MGASRPRARVARPGPGARGRCRTGAFTCRAVRVGAVASLRRLGAHLRNASETESCCWSQALTSASNTLREFVNLPPLSTGGGAGGSMGFSVRYQGELLGI
eukprot:scaffold1039_cov47-Phaeocystis_antarctica.AAC.2